MTISADEHLARPHHLRVSDILSGLGDRLGEREVTLGELLDAFGERGFGAGLFLFSLPSTLLLSSVPGVSSLFAVPIVLLAGQWLFGAENPWLPRRLRDHRLGRRVLPRIIAGAERALGWIERLRLLKPRLAWLSGMAAQRLSALVVIVSGVVLFLPIPLGNFAPGLAITLIALGTLEQDGLMILVGNLVGVASSLVLLGAVSLGVEHSWAMLFG